MRNIEVLSPHFINVKGRLIRLDKPLIMGILNITPDSFYDGGKWFNNAEKLATQATQMIKDGASIIDIGGYSSRPGADHISEEEEIRRVVEAIEVIKNCHHQILISVDTFRANVAKKAVESGADIINDISGGNLDERMFETVANLGVPYILMHMRGTPQTMQKFTKYDDLLLEMIDYFQEKVYQLRKLGCKDIIIDPGFGFAKNLNQNYLILKQLDQFNILNLPMLIGLSRKSMIYKKLNILPDLALNGTTALNAIAIEKGAAILRVHDVKEAREIVDLLTDN
ncbi:dihydropteroate synthase [Flexithrix dorotheae]|uniref:dihydropteroate synthase n=1 Tax=Flexithrix dorotheae TaxID=70993 RepID=UPI000369DE9A|nr:dihydropteroate synthase [Flexithrix dorotheae]